GSSRVGWRAPSGLPHHWRGHSLMPSGPVGARNALRRRTRGHMRLARISAQGRAAMAAKMLAVGYAASLPITEERSLFEFETPVPDVSGRDLLVRVKAVSVNPIDVKVRMRKQGTPAQPVILGWDAAGIVEAVGPDCRLFGAGDPVYYAGNINRP